MRVRVGNIVTLCDANVKRVQTQILRGGRRRWEGGRGGRERKRGGRGGARAKSPIRPPTLRNITSSNVER